MARNKILEERIRKSLAGVPNVSEKSMFRGLSFMVNDKLCLSAGDQEIMCRLDPDLYEDHLAKEGCRTVVMKGKPIKGYIYVHEKVLTTKSDLDYWIDLSLDYNKRAKSSKKKHKESKA